MFNPNQTQVKLLLMLFLFVWLAGCATPGRVELGNKEYGQTPIDIYLVPMEGISLAYATSIAREIESHYKLRTKATTVMGKDPSMFNSVRQQYIANAIAKRADEIINALKNPNEHPFVLVLTPYDINAQEFDLRFLFAAHYQRISVVSTARIDPVNYGLPRDDKLRDERLMKLINKTIGQQVLHYPISSDRNNMMFGPIMGLDDLDSITRNVGYETP